MTADQKTARRKRWANLLHGDATIDALEKHAPGGTLPLGWEWTDPRQYPACIERWHRNGEPTLLRHEGGHIIFEPDESVRACSYALPCWLLDVVRAVGEAHERHMATGGAP